MATWIKEKKYDREIKWILFLISPFIGFIASLKDIKTRSSFSILFLFFFLFGLSFSVGNIRDEQNTNDAVSYRAEFEAYKNISFDEYIQHFRLFLTFKWPRGDYYFDTVAFIVSRISSNYHIMFAIFAIVFAFFSLKCSKLFIEEDSFDTSISSYILLYIFFINQIININGMRFWTAAWVAVYSAFRIFRNHDRRYFLLALATPFFHRAYWIFIIITIISYILRNRNRVLIFLFFISFIVSRNSVSFFQKLSNSLPPIWSQAVLNYANEEYIQLRNQPGSGFYWLGNVFRYLEEYYIYLLIFLLIINANKISKDDRTSNIFCFLLVLMTFVNISMPIPSLGGRFLTLAYPIVAYIWLVHFKGRKYTQILYMMPFVFSFSILYLVAKEYPKVTDIWLYCANPFYLLYRYLFL